METTHAMLARRLPKYIYSGPVSINMRLRIISTLACTRDGHVTVGLRRMSLQSKSKLERKYQLVVITLRVRKTCTIVPKKRPTYHFTPSMKCNTLTTVTEKEYEIDAGGRLKVGLLMSLVAVSRSPSMSRIRFWFFLKLG